MCFWVCFPNPKKIWGSAFKTQKDAEGKDGPLLPLRNVIQDIERTGVVDFDLAGHSFSRPAAVYQEATQDDQHLAIKCLHVGFDFATKWPLNIFCKGPSALCNLCAASGFFRPKVWDQCEGLHGLETLGGSASEYQEQELRFLLWSRGDSWQPRCGAGYWSWGHLLKLSKTLVSVTESFFGFFPGKIADIYNTI